MVSNLRSLSLCTVLLVGALVGSSPTAFAAGTPTKPVNLRDLPAETRIPNTRHIEFTSKVNGNRYAIDVALPFSPSPPEGYKVLYVLDGYGYFASAVEATRANGNASDVVVVGIGYPDDKKFIDRVLTERGPVPDMMKGEPPFEVAAGLERQYDLTLPATDAVLAAQSIPGFPTLKPAQVGGIDNFLKTIETEVKPRVAKLAKIDRDNQALFGHSLGGLAVLQALFTEPQAFRTFIAASPSIWWSDKAVLAKEEAFNAQVASGKARPRVLITTGAEEEKIPQLPPSFAAHAAAIEAFVRKSRMVGNACDLAGRLKVLQGTAPYEVADCAVFANQGHGISPWPALGRAVQFAFRAE